MCEGILACFFLIHPTNVEAILQTMIVFPSGESFVYALYCDTKILLYLALMLDSDGCYIVAAGVLL